ncbi:MAG TPA: ATP-binding protein [Oligoflexus sp.]|uniref:ATP-binding protein n=1 Tax=Oligoflexus sp. TaxID=1971216 RepID=UPI002D75AD0C|nr:ATP-binding protein [Oligoflexus sp.]HYX33906.1 ATP-binding protein [Oligoflexus sp.]
MIAIDIKSINSKIGIKVTFTDPIRGTELENVISGRAAYAASDTMFGHKTDTRPAEDVTCILSAAKVGVWELDLKRGFLKFDDTMYNLFGLKRDDCPNLLDTYQVVIHPDDRQLVMIDAYERIYRGESQFNIEFRIVHRDGMIRYILANLFVERSQDGIPSKVVGVDCDVTELRNAQLKHQRPVDHAPDTAATKTSAESANRFKTRFLANISHEIRTPLAVIRGSSEILASHEVDPQKKIWIDKIIHSGEQLELLINDIMDVSKVEAGKLEVELGSVDLARILAEVKDHLSEKVTEKRIRLDFVIEGQVPTIIQTDPLRLKQILLNIIGNSIKFTDHGHVSLTIKLLPASDETSHTYLAFVVSDTGIGMTPEEKERIFKAFSQADSSISRRFGGTGLGLSISLGLAHLLGGDIVVSNSEPGKGSTFTVTINPGPISTPVLTGSAAFEIPSSVATPVPQADKRLKGLKILLVEDAEDIRATITYLLVLQGALVAEVVNGLEGVELVRKSAFDLILMDIQMPVFDGFRAIQLLRSEGCDLPVFALTAHTMKGERERCIAAGFTDYLPKPIHISNLISMIDEYRQS